MCHYVGLRILIFLPFTLVGSSTPIQRHHAQGASSAKQLAPKCCLWLEGVLRLTEVGQPCFFGWKGVKRTRTMARLKRLSDLKAYLG